MVNAKNIIIGTRKSALAKAQSFAVKNYICNSSDSYKKNPDLISIKGFQTSGDSILDKNLSDIGGKGLFTKEIEEALIAKEISIAAHSMKDMPAEYPKGLVMKAILEREDPRDAFISLKYKSIESLPKNAIMGTSSARRKAFLLRKRPDLKIVNFRGNVNTRLRKLEEGEVDATILAVAGLKRINMEKYISSIIAIEDMLPAIGQGAIGAQCRAGDNYSCNILSDIDHFKTRIAVTAERAFLAKVDGSCKMPIAGYCQITEDNTLLLKVAICSLDGNEIYETYRLGSFDDAQLIGSEAGDEIIKNAQHILRNL